MHKKLRVFSFALVALALSLTVAIGRSSAPIQDEPPVLEDLAWLAGHWKQQSERGLVEELWMPARGGMMLGLNRTSSAKGRAQFEYLRIEQRGDQVVYLASPSGAKPTPFPLVKLDGQYAIFENPEHDFPKVIEYRLEDDKLEVSIAADEPGPAWTFERVGDVE